MLRIAIVLPADPIGYNETEGGGDNEDGKVFVVFVFCKRAQHLQKRQLIRPPEPEYGRTYPDALYRVKGAE